MTERRSGSNSPRFELPDLDLTPLKSQRRGATPEGAVASSAQKSAVSWAEDADRGGFRLELGSKIETPGHNQFGRAGFDLDDSGVEFEVDRNCDSLSQRVSGVRTSDPTRKKAWPTGRSPDWLTLNLDNATIAELAGYGVPPQNLLTAPLYTWRVIRRRRALRQDLAPRRRALAASEVARDELLCALVSEQRRTLEQDPRFQRVFQPISEAEQTASQGTRELSSLRTQYDVELAELENQMSELRAARSSAENQLSLSSNQHASRDLDFKRAEARMKRMHIEARALQEAAEHRATPQAPAHYTLEEFRRFTEIQTAAQQLEPELQTLRKNLEAATAAVDQAQDQVHEWARQQGELERTRLLLVEKFEAGLRTQSKEMERIQAGRRAALAEVGRNALELRALRLPERSLSLLRQADAEVLKLGTEAELHLRALRAHDAVALKHGYLVTVGAVLLILAGIAAKLFLS